MKNTLIIHEHHTRSKRKPIPQHQKHENAPKYPENALMYYERHSKVPQSAPKILQSTPKYTQSILKCPKVF